MQQTELNQIRRVGVSRKWAGPRPLTLDLLLPEMIEPIQQEVLAVLGKMESNRTDLEREAGLDDARERGLGSCH